MKKLLTVAILGLFVFAHLLIGEWTSLILTVMDLLLKKN